MRVAVAYTRVSAGEQARGDLSLEAQAAAIRHFASDEGIDLVETFAEDRPGLSRALARARNLHCPVIVWTLDRLSREAPYVSNLTSQGVQVVVAEKGPDTDLVGG